MKGAEFFIALNGVYKMCVHCSRYRISFKKSYSGYIRNGVYKMCVKATPAILGTVYTKCVYTVPQTVVGIEFPLKKATLAI